MRLVEAMEVDDFLVYDLPDPGASVGGTTQHPLQKVVANHGEYRGKRFRTFRHGAKVYVVRLS